MNIINEEKSNRLTACGGHFVSQSFSVDLVERSKRKREKNKKNKQMVSNSRKIQFHFDGIDLSQSNLRQQCWQSSGKMRKMRQ